MHVPVSSQAQTKSIHGAGCRMTVLEAAVTADLLILSEVSALHKQAVTSHQLTACYAHSHSQAISIAHSVQSSSHSPLSKDSGGRICCAEGSSSHGASRTVCRSICCTGGGAESLGGCSHVLPPWDFPLHPQQQPVLTCRRALSSEVPRSWGKAQRCWSRVSRTPCSPSRQLQNDLSTH